MSLLVTITGAPQRPSEVQNVFGWYGSIKRITPLNEYSETFVPEEGTHDLPLENYLANRAIYRVVFKNVKDAQEAFASLQRDPNRGKSVYHVEWDETPELLQPLPDFKLIVTNIPENADVNQVVRDFERFGPIKSLKYVLEIVYSNQDDFFAVRDAYHDEDESMYKLGDIVSYT